MCQWSSAVGGELSAAGTEVRAYTIVPTPMTRIARTIIGNKVPPWKRTRLPLPFWASRAAFFVDEEDTIGWRRLSVAPLDDSAATARPCDGGRSRYRCGPM